MYIYSDNLINDSLNKQIKPTTLENLSHLSLALPLVMHLGFAHFLFLLHT
jgi:hypothetical protein